MLHLQWGLKTLLNILEEIKDKPNAVIILDEIDKAHPKVINLLYQVLEDNKLKTSKGDVVRFDNNIIIMTSNVGFDKNYVGFNINDNNVYSELKEEFNSAFINRIDNIVIFNRLNKDDIIKIINNKLDELKLRYSNIKLSFSNELINELIVKINYKEYGARKIDKIIYTNIENYILDKILLDEKNINVSQLNELMTNN